MQYDCTLDVCEDQVTIYVYMAFGTMCLILIGFIVTLVSYFRSEKEQQEDYIIGTGYERIQ